MTGTESQTTEQKHKALRDKRERERQNNTEGGRYKKMERGTVRERKKGREKKFKQNH